MVTGISSGAWGYSTANVAGLRRPMEINGHPLTYEESLTSYPPSFKDRRMVSPISLANQSYYVNFGKGTFGKLTKNKCIQFLKSNGTINPLTNRVITKNGPTWKSIMNKCSMYSLIPSVPSVPSLSNVSSVPNVSSITLSSNSLRNDFKPPIVDPMFIGNIPEVKQVVRKSVKRKVDFKVNHFDKTIRLNGKIFGINDVARIYPDNTPGTIISIGPKQIVLRRLDDNQNRRLKHKEFKELNKN